MKYAAAHSIAVAAGIGLLTALNAPATAQTTAPAAPSANEAALKNFGLPFGFSTEKMDLKADPRKDFRRYAAGRWMDAATLPSDSVRISGIDVLVKRVEVQVQSVLSDAARASASATAAKGSPTQQGVFLCRRHGRKAPDRTGGAPLKPELDRITRSRTARAWPKRWPA